MAAAPIKLKKRDFISIGFMTFAMYLGAGNLIFPPMIGLQSGENFYSAVSGFLLTGVGLPAIALVIIALINGSDQLTSALPSWAVKLFWVSLFIIIGPTFIIPRTITVAYEFISNNSNSVIGLPAFSILFCLIAALFSLFPNKLITSLGKVLTPLLLTLLLALGLAVILFPMSTTSSAAVAYIDTPFADGLAQGYMTMDSLGSIGFGWIIFSAIRRTGVTNDKQIAKYTLCSTLIYAVPMALLYTLLAYIGSNASGLLGEAVNGAAILTSVASHYFGSIGVLGMSMVVIIACLTTAIGVTTAASEFYESNFSWISFRFSVVTIMLLSAVIANFGLEQLLSVTLPAVMIIHPVTISLLLLAPWRKINKASVLYGLTLFCAALFGSLDALKVANLMPEQLDHTLNHWLPLYSFNAGWVLPTITIMVLFILRARISRKNNSNLELKQADIANSLT